MSSLKIYNVGPVKHIELQLNRINVFIGPQGCGKSTVAKILSFCLWLQKTCVKLQRTDHLGHDKLDSLLDEYHNMEGYFSDDSRFEFENEVIKISYKKRELFIEKGIDFYTTPLSKNAYIPSERNIISFPIIFSTKMPDNYIRDFIIDWQSVREKYRNGAKVELLDTKRYYTYDSDSKSDYIIEKNDDKDGLEDLPQLRRFPLSESSSGIQSVTPLCVMIDYLTQWIYQNTEDRSALDLKSTREAAIARYVATHSDQKDILELAGNDKNIAANLEKLSESLRIAMDGVFDLDDSIEKPKVIKEYRDILIELIAPHCSNIVIEEPELNLFPTTQVELVYYILSKINHTRDTLVITTHSPYILYALNNCMLAGRIAQESKEELAEMAPDIPEGAYTLPADVSVWELNDGSIREGRTIQDANGMIRDNYFDRIMQNVMADFRNMLNLI